jgi:PKD repeat protein
LGTNTTFNFTDETTGGVLPYTYEWDFDNNGTIDSTLQNPVYTYPDAGTYTVALTVTDVLLDEDTETKEDYLMVYKPGDANADCEINMADVDKVERIILRLDPPTIWGDASQDGAINMADVTTIEWIIIRGLGGYYC